MSTPATVMLSKFYELDLTGARAVIEEIGWDSVPAKSKLRRFFLRDDWQDNVVSFSVSSGGAKGGVFFLGVDCIDKAALVRALGDKATAEDIWNKLIQDDYIVALPDFVEGVKTKKARVANLDLPVKYGKTKIARQPIVTVLTQANVRRKYVVKGTNEPQRTLFAEYCLNRIGKAKIPKSLMLEVDPMRPHNRADPSEGMVMLDLLKAPIQNAQLRAQGFDLPRYRLGLEAIFDSVTNKPQVDYLIVQKLIPGEQVLAQKEAAWLLEDFLVETKIRIGRKSFASDPAFANAASDDIDNLFGELGPIGCTVSGIVSLNFKTSLPKVTYLKQHLTDIERILQGSLDAFQSYGLNRQSYEVNNPEGQLDQLAADLKAVANIQPGSALARLKGAFDNFKNNELGRAVTVNSNIFQNPTKMENLGRILFADLVCGNADRLEQLNTGNFFFTTKRATKPDKLDDPIGCIDSDAFLPANLREATIPGRQTKQGFKTTKDYVRTVIKGGKELWGSAKPCPQNYTFAPTSNLTRVLDIDGWFKTEFVGGFIHGDFSILGLDNYPNTLYAGDPSVNQVVNLQGWKDALKYIKTGFGKALIEYNKTNVSDFRQVYRELRGAYGSTVNFDFTAFELRDAYLRATSVDSTATPYTITPIANSDGWIQAKANELTDVLPQKIAPRINAAIQFVREAQEKGKPKIFDHEGQVEDLLDFLIYLSVAEQEKLIFNPFSKRGKTLGELDNTKRAKVEKQWDNQKEKVKSGINALICLILKHFQQRYRNESLDQVLFRVSVLDSAAYSQAVASAKGVAEHQVGGSESELKKYLSAYDLGAYYA